MMHRIQYILGLVGLVCWLPSVMWGGQVEVGSSRLIVGTPVISDTFATAGAVNGRAPQVRPDGSTITLRGNGSASDGTMTSGAVMVDYGLSKTYVIQFDGKQVWDRIDVNIGAAGAGAGIGGGKLSLFIRGSNHNNVYPGVGVYNGSTERVVAPINSSLPASGDWANYAVVGNATLNQAKIFVNEQFVTSVNFNEYKASTYTLNNGAVGFDASPGSSFDNMQVGTYSRCVTVGNSTLIQPGTLDYSDTFNKQVRINEKEYTKYFDNNGTQRYYEVESCYGNPQRRWTGWWSLEDSKSGYNIGNTGYNKADSYAGAMDGFSQNGGINPCPNFMEYGGLRDQFTFQVDMIQPTNQSIILTVGDEAKIDVTNNNNLSFYFTSGDNSSKATLQYYKDGAVKTYDIYTGAEADSLPNNTWNNFAVRMDTLNMEAEVYAGEWSLGKVNLNSLGIASVGTKYIGYTGQENNFDRCWADNFQIGETRMTGVTAGNSKLYALQDNWDVKLEDRFTSDFSTKNGNGKYYVSPKQQWYDNGKALSGFEVYRDGNFDTVGTGAGSASGAVLMGTNIYSTALANPDVPPSHLFMQADVLNQTLADQFNASKDPQIGFYFGEGNNGQGDSLLFNFGTYRNGSNKFTLSVNGANAVDVTAKLANAKDVPLTSGVWTNLAVYADNDLGFLEIFANEVSLGILSFEDLGLESVIADYVGFKSLNSNYFMDNFQAGSFALPAEASLPEPTSWALLLLGAGLCGT